MGNFVDCWGQHIGDSKEFTKGDKDAILAKIREHTDAGIDPAEAAKLAVESHLGDTHEQLQSIYEQAGVPVKQTTADYLSERKQSQSIQGEVNKQQKEATDLATHFDEQAKVAENPKVKATLEQMAQKYRDQSKTVTTPEYIKENIEPKFAPPEPPKVEADSATTQGSPTGIRNEIVDKQRVDRGLPERMKPLRQTNQEAWDSAMKRLDENPDAAKNLMAEIKDHPRALKPEETALLSHETVTRENGFDNAVDTVNKAKTPEELAQAKAGLEAARDSVQELYDVGQNQAGYESGASLQARQMLVNKDYTLSRMEATRRAIANDGKPLSEAQLAEVKELHEKIQSAKSAVDVQEAFSDLMKQSVKDARQARIEKKGVSVFLSEQADKARLRIRARLAEGRLNIGLDPLDVADHAIVGADYIAKGVSKFGDWSAQMVKDFGDKITPYLKEIWERAKQFYEANKKELEDRRLSAAKSRTLGGIIGKVAKIERGDLSRETGIPIQPDTELTALRAKYQQVKNEFETLVEKDRLGNRPNWQKVLEQVAGAARASALSGYHTLAKLATYDLAKLVEMPLTEAVGKVISKTPGLRDISAKANLEAGGSTLKAIGSFYKGVAVKGMKEAWNVLRRGSTESKLLYGKPNYIPPKWYDFFGNLHMAEKAPILTGTQEMYLSRAYENAIRDGLDPSNEFTKAAINKAVYDYSQKSILQENNKFADAVNGLHARLEKVNPKTGQVDIANSVISTLVKTLLTKGIVRTPANYVAQTIARTPAGLATGLIKAGMAKYRGVGNLHPVEANAINAAIKVGAVGTAFFVLGAIDATKKKEDRTFGGYWEPGRSRDDGDAKWGTIRIAGKTLPHLATHNPLTESAQMGNTMMRVAISKFRKSDESNQGMVQGAVKSVIGLAGKAPIASPVMRMDQNANVVGDLLQGLVPQLIQNIAEDTDSVEKRDTKSTANKLKAFVPVLRQTVPQPKQKVIER